MLTKLSIDSQLLKKARTLGKHATNREAVYAALNDYIRLQESKKLTDLFGTMECFNDFDPRAARGKPSMLHLNREKQLSSSASRAKRTPTRKRSKR